MSAAACARVGAVGRSSASSSRSQWRAGSVPNTLPAPLMTAGTPTASSASRISAAVRLVCTSTATWPGRTGPVPAISAPEFRSFTMSAARSFAMYSRAGPVLA